MKGEPAQVFIALKIWEMWLCLCERNTEGETMTKSLGAGGGGGEQTAPESQRHNYINLTDFQQRFPP